jgi:hypothetical protein
MGLFTRLWNTLRQLVGLVLPLFSRARDFAALGPTARAVLHILLVAAILALLLWLNWHFIDNIGPLVGRAPYAIQYIYLPLLFGIVYALSWLGWWLWQLLWGEDEASPFPDIDDAWREAVAAPTPRRSTCDAPLFLVLGRPAGGEPALFQAHRCNSSSASAAADRRSARRLGRHRWHLRHLCRRLATGRFARLLVGGGGEAQPCNCCDGEFGRTRHFPQGRLRECRESSPTPMQRVAAPISSRRKNATRFGNWSARMSHGRAPGRTAANRLLKNHEEVERCVARLGHLCKLLTRDRRPFCPVNGVLILLPLAALTDDEEASQAASVCQLDLAAARQNLQMTYPVFAAVCDLETAPGFSEFLARFPSEQRRSPPRAAPLVSELEGEADGPGRSDGPMGMPWAAGNHTSTSCSPPRAARDPDAAAAIRGNAQLYQFMVHLRKASRNLARVLTRGLVWRVSVSAGGGPPADAVRFGGCYLCGTAGDVRGQGFIAGLFRRLKDSENAVSWSPEAVAEEADNLRWTQYGYVVLAVFVAVLLGLGVRLWMLTSAAAVTPPVPQRHSVRRPPLAPLAQECANRQGPSYRFRA